MKVFCHRAITRKLIPGFFLHVIDCIRNWFNEIKVITSDTDVVVIALGCFYLRPEKLWIKFGVGKHRRWLPIHTYVNILGESKCAGYYFGTLSLDATRFLHFVEEGRKRPGIYGIRFPKLQRHLIICHKMIVSRKMICS